MAKVAVTSEPTLEPTLDAAVRLLAVEQRLAAIEAQQQIHQQTLELMKEAIEEHLEDTGNDPYRISLLEQVTGGLTQITERIYAIVQAVLQGRRRV